MNDNTILPVRFFLKEQYKELKDNGEFTGVNAFTGEEETVPNIPQALNCVADTTEQDIAKVQQEIAEVKDQVASNLKKYYRHIMGANFETSNGFLSLLFTVVSSKEQAYTENEFLNRNGLMACTAHGSIYIGEYDYKGTVSLLIGNGYIYYDGVLGNNDTEDKIICVNGGESSPGITDDVEEI